MKLRDYINTYPRNKRREIRELIANAAGVTEQAVRHWVNGIRTITAERVFDVELVTDGRVTRHDLRPDLWPIDYQPPYPPAATASTQSATGGGI